MSTLCSLCLLTYYLITSVGEGLVPSREGGYKTRPYKSEINFIMNLNKYLFTFFYYLCLFVNSAFKSSMVTPSFTMSTIA